MTFQDELGRFYRDHRDYLEQVFEGVFAMFGEEIFEESLREISDDEIEADDRLQEFCLEYTRSMAHRLASSAEGQLVKIVNEAPVADAAAVAFVRVVDWTETKADKIAFRDSVQAGAAFAKFAWRQAGVIKLVWRAVGKNCPLCNNLDGKIVGIDESFARSGDVINPNDVVTNALNITSNIGHPQLHQGCDCMISPA